MASLNHNLVNSLALRFAKWKKKEVFEELYEAVRPMVYHEARKAEERTGIPREDFISLFSEDVWQAASGQAVKDFDGSSNFSQRLHTFFERSKTDAIRHRTAGRRRFKTEYLSNPVKYYEGNQETTYADVIPLPYSLENEVGSSDAVKRLLAGFRRANERDFTVIAMILEGHSKQEIANVLGSEKYDARTRQIVTRSRNAFRDYVSKFSEAETG